MTSAFLSRRMALLATLATSLFIAACGGDNNNDTGTSSIRAVNLSSDLASVDLFVDGSKRFDAQATDALSEYIGLTSATYTLNVKRAGDGASLLTGSYTLSKDQHYTAVVWGREASLRLSTLPEDENSSNISAGNARLRVFNATTDSGALDVYLTTPTADLGSAAATQANLASGTLGGFRDLSASSYRLRVTGAGNPNDLRLDMPALVLGSQQHATLVITAGGGGVLVNGTLIVQQGAATTLKSRKARVRLAAGVDSAAAVSATVGSASVSGAVASPRVGGYVLVDSGTANLTLRVNGAVASTTSHTFADGVDYTVLAHGPAAAPVVALLEDDNRLPSAATRAKLRLVNGATGAGPLTLTLDNELLQPSDIAEGAASTYYAANAAIASRFVITSQTATQPLFTQVGTSTERLLQSQGIYTVFILGGLAAPEGVFRRDR